jgi:lipopolysaccharide transport system permease protein
MGIVVWMMGTSRGTNANDSIILGEPSIVIRQRRAHELLDVREIWSYRELLGFLAWRDLKVRYKQTAIGVAWAVIQPLAMMAVFTVFFGQLARVPSDGHPYHLFALAALIPWALFARVLSASSDSLIRDQRLISKVYFPRLIVPLSTAIAALVDFAISIALLLALVLASGLVPSSKVLALLPLTLLLVIAALGVGFWLSSLNVEFRDVQHVLPFLTQLWFFLTPVVYPVSLVPDRFQLLYSLNPMVGVIEGYRWILLGSSSPSSLSLTVSVVVAVALLVSGTIYFRSRERGFADSLN